MQRIYDSNTSRRRARLVANWENNILHFYGESMWLKVETGNETFDSTFGSHKDEFCK
ncbi:hypothetical protein PSTG_17482 [Puccinia striiformis f. sp. tritici PST-78]|uniref:Uncharacterized protein n=1 Tax=Puccinia striiformis f. sp. tritici PST-78 TaxID=1165861 RepID=A0A0L0UQ16_9BASI|nr:hypothetical protein PSTG_17482 [Puccinia striiformis f. sp. tritici PST-78]